MRVAVDLVRCQGNGVCADAAPTVFVVKQDGRLRVLLDEPGEELRRAVEHAARRCPTQAISVSA